MEIIEINYEKNNNFDEKITKNEMNCLLNSFKFDNNDFKYEINETIFWFEGNQILTFLGYDNHNDIIKKHIKDKYIKTLSELKNNDTLNFLDDNEKNAIYISEYGLNQLLAISKLDNTIVNLFQDKLFEEILPSIRRTGNYIYGNINYDTSQLPKQITYFNDVNNITPYLNLNVIYIGETGEMINVNDDNKMLYKFGKSSGSIDRDFRENKKNFPNFRIILIVHCDNNDIIEEYLKIELMAKNMIYEPPKKSRKKKNTIIHDKKQIDIIKPSAFSETFILTEKFDLNDVINLIKNLVDEYPLESIKKRNEKIKELQCDNRLKEKEIELQIKEEETKQKLLEFETRQMEKREELEKMKIELEKLKIELEIKKLISNSNINLNTDKTKEFNINISDININYDKNNENDENNIDDIIKSNDDEIKKEKTDNDIFIFNDKNDKNNNKNIYDYDENIISDEVDSIEQLNSGQNKSFVETIESDIVISNNLPFYNNDDKKLSDSLFGNDDMHFLMTDDIFKNNKLFENDTLKVKKWRGQLNNIILNYSNLKDIKLYDKFDKLKEYTTINKKIPIGKDFATKLIPFMKSK